jgi:hypothetical protein
MPSGLVLFRIGAGLCLSPIYPSRDRTPAQDRKGARALSRAGPEPRTAAGEHGEDPPLAGPAACGSALRSLLCRLFLLRLPFPVGSSVIAGGQ